MDNSRAMDSADEVLHTFLVEHYWPDATAKPSGRSWPGRSRGGGPGPIRAALRLLHSTFVPEQESALCVFSSSGPGLVEEAYQRAGIGFERILTC